MLSLSPFPYFHRLPSGEVEELPVTRDGVRSLSPFPFQKVSGPTYQELKIRPAGTNRTIRGICGLLPASAFTDGTVRPHELTLAHRLDRQCSTVTADRGALGKPILLTTPSLRLWWQQQDDHWGPAGPSLIFQGDHHRYRLTTYAPKDVHFNRLDAMPPLVIADGHHRAYTHANLAAEGFAPCRWVPVVIAGADELTIGSFLRIISGMDLSVEQLLDKLQVYFIVTPRETSRPPSQVGDWLLAYRRQNFLLRRRESNVAGTDAGWLNEHVLPAVFGITDIRSDDRITFDPPPDLIEETLPLGSELADRIILYGFPLPPEVFFSEVTEGRTLPPKSTRFEPRVPSGLLVWVPEAT